MTKPELNINARDGLRVVLAAGFLLLLGANLPGHLSYDSVAQLYEGHFHVRETWGPASYAWLLGLFDAVIPGTALYVVASALLLFLSLASFDGLRNRIGWAGVAVAALVLLTPQVLVYQAIVWKDVMFANAAVAALVLLAHAARDWDDRRRRWLWLVGVVLLLALASLVRQNGIIVTAMAALALGWIASRGRWVRGGVWALGLLFVVLLAAQGLTRLAEPANAPPDTAFHKGVRILQNYDIAGAVTLDPGYRLTALEKADPVAAKVIESRAPLGYSGQRIDFLDDDAAFGAALWDVPDPAIRAQWADLVLRHPVLYLRVRMEDFRWVFATPVVDRCLPIYVGVDAPAEKMQPLGLQHRFTHADRQLMNYHTWFLDTPLYSHVAYAALGLVLAGLLLARRDPADIAMIALLLSGVAFAASFFVISIACDYRYLYFTDLSALVGLVYVAVDFPLRRRRAAA
ncbi:hypothetical protein DJ021_09280 [Phenylobacterium hankyongense]|uniref:Glycosyltransferase RgtA/B/C/D-like domain-containing protein n=1 Tax=Phenylobacterium hankyongense TaxID=1813876 RepID=A0A328AY07_9CAUL|nr:hypothetical protein [Phenylobacterium hankyongense]RAK59980.1 hypothetical protein DJ021_09280 [Phenylobacterium hankyongense]